MGEKQLIVAVEGTAAVGPHWKTIVSDYLDKIVRSFSGNDSIGQKPPTMGLQLGLVVFYTHGSYNACLVQRSGWTRDIDIFFQWLSAISFCGGGFNDAAIAEGLSEALMMFCPIKANQTQQNMEGQRHCILVAASNPYPLPTPVYRPQQLQKMEQTESTEAQTDNRLSDAETIAKSFGPCSVSLSVICPKQLPKLKAIFNAGKYNPRTDLPVDIAKNPSFLVLISENLMEGRSALSRPGMQNVSVTQSPVKVDITSAQPIVSGPLPTSIPTANGSIRPVTVGNVPSATVKVEPPTITAMAGPVFPNMSSVPRPAAPAVASLQTSSPMSSSKDMMMSPPESLQDMKPAVSSMPQTIRPAGPAAANVRILNDVARQALAGSSSIGLQSMGGTPMLSNMLSSGMGSSVPAPQSVLSSSQSALTSIATSSMPLTGNVQPSQNSAPASFTSATSNISQNSNPNMPQTINNLQSGGNMGQSVSAMNQATLPSTQMGQSGINMSQNILSGIGASGMPSATGAMMPTPMMSQPQQTGLQQLGIGNNTAANMSISQQNAATLQSAQSKYVKVWEGNLSGQRQGQPVFITRLEGYRSASASESLAANWPPTMQIVRLISQDHMNNKQYVGKADFLVFRAMNQHGFLGQLQEKKLCAVIQLPSQTLLLSVSDKACRLIGMLFPGDMVVFKPQISNQQQQQQMQQQQHQQQLQQQQQLQVQQHQQLQQQQPSMPQLQQQPHLSQLQQQQQQQQISQLQQQQQQQQQQQPIQQLQQQQPQQQPMSHMQQQQPLMQLQQQQQQHIPQLQQQQQMSQLPQQQQQQQQQQQMGGTTMGQTYVQGSGRSPLMSQGQGASNISGGGGFMN